MCKYFAEAKQEDENTNKVQKHLQLHDVSFGEYIGDKYALWLYFWKIDGNILHGTGRKIGNSGGGGEITLLIEKKAEIAGALKVYIYLVMDSQLNIDNGAFQSFDY